MKKNIFIVLFFIISIFLYSNDIKFIKGKSKINYYGFPFSFSYGLNYRYNDFEFIMPYLGLRFDINPNPEFDIIIGSNFIYKNYFCSLKGFSELWNPEVKPFSKDFQFGGSFEIGILGTNSKVTLGSSVEQKRWTDNNFLNKQSYFTLKEYINLNLLLFNTAYCESTAVSNLSFYILPENNFYSYETEVNIPFTINYCWGESCFLYSGFYSSEINTESKSNTFRISKNYNQISKRLSFLNDSKYYNNIQSLEFEQRIYPTKIFNYPVNLFLSFFANGGIGFTEKQSCDFLWELGGGIGFNLFGTVPFTFQAGINSDNNFIIYLGIVSKIVHNP